MATKWIEMMTGSLEQKKQYKLNIARLKALDRQGTSPTDRGNRSGRAKERR